MNTIPSFYQLAGIVSTDTYNTAWVALVPDAVYPNKPQWPQALDAIRAAQLPDGGWGAPNIYHPHERTICSLAAICALLTWQEKGSDRERVNRALVALRKYAKDLESAPLELVGYELLLPRLITLLKRFNLKLPEKKWSRIVKIGEHKLGLIGNLEIDPSKPQTWWFNLEMLPADRLQQLDDSILNHHGSIVTAVAPTAAYLRACRLNGNDSQRAAAYISRVLGIGKGNAAFAWPIEHFETLWMLDQFKRVKFPVTHPKIYRPVRHLLRHWSLPPYGFSSSAAFHRADGDDTSVAYDVLRWAGFRPSPEPLLAFWHINHFRTYLHERTASVTVNLHMLSALRHDHYKMFSDYAALVIGWLRPQLNQCHGFLDKWHFSPIYVAAHALEILLEWDPALAKTSLDFLLEQQQRDGGWGCCSHSTVEETNHAVIGLLAAYDRGVLKNKRPLQHAAHFLYNNRHNPALERLWIGKTLFHSPKISEALRFSAMYGLTKANITIKPYQISQYSVA